MTSKLMTGGEAAIESLAAHGLHTIFGIPGGHSLSIYDALSRQTRVRHVLGRHEQGLGFMADGFSRASGDIGVVTVTSGPGVANLGAALGGATTDTSSVLVIASTIPLGLIGRNRGHIHECGESLEMVRPLCRYAERATSVTEVPDVLSSLIHRLRTGRPGAAYCEIPADILDETAQVELPSPAPLARLQPDQRDVARAVRLLAEAERPLIWAGTGAVVSGADVEVAELARRLGAIVVTSALGRGIVPGDDPHVMMLDGGLLTEVNEVVADADVVLAVGTMFKQEDTANWATKLTTKLIHIDIDGNEIGRSYPADVGIVADARDALRSLLHELPPTMSGAATSWRSRAKDAERARLAKRRSAAPQDIEVLDILRESVPRDGIVVADRCSLGYWAFRCMPAFAPRTFQYPLGYGGLGGALPQAIGAKIARPDVPVICVIGDGGFQFTATELAVARQEGVPITVVLCNNQSYGAIRAKQDRSSGRRFGEALINPDFRQLAAAYGFDTQRVDTVDGFSPALQSAIASDALSVIELTVEISDP